MKINDANFMKFRRYTIIILLVIYTITGLAGCSGYGRLRLVSGQATGISIQHLEDHWQEYEIYYSMWPADQPVAVLFDPKDDGKRLAAERWLKMPPGKNALSRTLRSIQPRYSPKLYEIWGPDDQLYGYVYSGRSSINLEVVGENVLRVHDVEIPAPKDA